MIKLTFVNSNLSCGSMSSRDILHLFHTRSERLSFVVTIENNATNNIGGFTI